MPFELKPARVSIEFGFSPLSDEDGRSHFNAAHIEEIDGETVAYFTKAEATKIAEHFNAAADEWRPHSGEAKAEFVENLGRSPAFREDGFVFVTVDGERFEWYGTLTGYGTPPASLFNIGRHAWSWDVEEAETEQG